MFKKERILQETLEYGEICGQLRIQRTFSFAWKRRQRRNWRSRGNAEANLEIGAPREHTHIRL